MRKSRDCRAIHHAWMRRVGAVLHGPDAAPEHVAHHRHTPIGRGEVFETVPGDAAMDADLRIVIAGDPLPVFVGPARILPEARTPPWFLALGCAVESDLHRVGVVEGNRPCRGRRAVDRCALGHRVGVRRKLGMFGGMKSATRTQTRSLCRRVSM